MSTAILADSPSFSPALAEMMRRNVEITLAACDVFRAWHRKNFVLKEPSLEQKLEHAVDVRALLFLIRSLQGAIADPALPLADLREQVEAMAWLLQDCWLYVHAPMDAHEAEELLAEVFPE